MWQIGNYVFIFAVKNAEMDQMAAESFNDHLVMNCFA